MSSSNLKQPSAGLAHSGSVRKILFLVLRLAIGVAILFYLVNSGRVDLRSLGSLFGLWPLTVLAVGVFLADILLMAIRVSLLFHAERLSLSLWSAVQLTLIGFFFSTFLPGAAGGDLAKLYYASKENHGRRAEVAAVLLFDRLIGMFSLLLLPLCFAPLFPGLLRSVPLLRRVLGMDALLAGALFMVRSAEQVRQSPGHTVLDAGPLDSGEFGPYRRDRDGTLCR
jgi:uncharacterized membrane protein YbhN (UPF0104 family)